MRAEFPVSSLAFFVGLVVADCFLSNFAVGAAVARRRDGRGRTLGSYRAGEWCTASSVFRDIAN